MPPKKKLKRSHDWSDMPADVLFTISGTLDTVSDYIHFRSVCSSWRSAAPMKRPALQLRSQLPWLLLPYDCNDEHGILTFVALSPDGVWEPHKFQIPDTARGRKAAGGVAVCGSGHGWLVLRKGPFRVFLLNPITGDRIQLPPLPKFLCSTTLNCTVASNPVADPNWTVIAYFSTGSLLCKRGHTKWTTPANKSNSVFEMMYVTRRVQYKHVFNRTEIRTKDFEIDMYHEVHGAETPSKFELWRCNDIGDNVLLYKSDLNQDSDDNIAGISVPALPGLRSNCIYFIEPRYVKGTDKVNHRIGIFDIKEKTIQLLPSCWPLFPENTYPEWFIPSF